MHGRVQGARLRSYIFMLQLSYISAQINDHMSKVVQINKFITHSCLSFSLFFHHRFLLFELRPEFDYRSFEIATV